MFVICSFFDYVGAMTEKPKIANLQREIERLGAENDALRQEVFSGSKTEAMLAFEYDRIPNFLKTPRAIRLQRKVATALLFIMPVMFVIVAVVGGISAYRDHQRNVEAQRGWSKLGADIRHDVQQELAH